MEAVVAPEDGLAKPGWPYNKRERLNDMPEFQWTLSCVYLLAHLQIVLAATALSDTLFVP